MREQAMINFHLASIYADNLLRTMRTMRDKLPFDPYT